MTPDIVNLTPQTGRMLAEGNKLMNVVDETLPGLRVVQPENFAVHLGVAFSFEVAFQLAAGATTYALGRLGANVVHLMHFLIRADQAPIQIQFFEAPTITAPGVAGAVRAKNRVQSSLSTTSVYMGPTVTADGLELAIDKILGANKDVGSNDLHSEWLLKPNTDYVFKLTNQSAQVANMVAGFIWHESTV